MSENGIPVAIIGGGIAGLATAYNLEKAGRAEGFVPRVTLFEGSSVIGGNLRTIRSEGYIVEEGPNGFLDNEPATLRLVDDLGLNDQLQRSRDAARQRFLMVNGRLNELPMSPPAFIKTGLLSPWAKLRVACEPFIPARKDLGVAHINAASDETVYDFGCRRLGRAFAEIFLDPMVKGVFGGDARRLSLAAAFPRMVELEQEYGSLFKALNRLSRKRKREGKGSASPGPSGILHSFTSGIAALPERLKRVIRGDIRMGDGVERVESRRDGWWIDAGDGKFGPFAAVIDASPAHAAAEHLPDHDLKALLESISYAPMAVISLVFDRSSVAHDLNGFGMLTPTRENRHLLGVLWSSSIFAGRSPESKVLIRCMAGGASDPEILSQSDADLLQLCQDELKDLYGLSGAAERSWIIRWNKAIAQFEPGHLGKLAAMDKILAGLPGLFLTGSSYRGVSINHCIAEAEKTASAAMKYLPSTAQRIQVCKEY